MGSVAMVSGSCVGAVTTIVVCTGVSWLLAQPENRQAATNTTAISGRKRIAIPSFCPSAVIHAVVNDRAFHDRQQNVFRVAVI